MKPGKLDHAGRDARNRRGEPCGSLGLGAGGWALKRQIDRTLRCQFSTQFP